MSRRTSAAVLAAVVMLLLAANLLFTARYVSATRAHEQRQGQIVQHKICATLSKLAALQPPAGNPASNPSRGYEQELHATLDQLGPDLGCS